MVIDGMSECRDNLRPCTRVHTPGAMFGVHHCIHDSLWCDDHINCGHLENMDELDCFREGIWSGLITVVIGPWMGTSILLLLAFCGVIYWRTSRLRVTRGGLGQPGGSQDINSYAESYELSSNMSSTHHMAIQVKLLNKGKDFIIMNNSVNSQIRFEWCAIRIILMVIPVDIQRGKPIFPRRTKRSFHTVLLQRLLQALREKVETSQRVSSLLIRVATRQSESRLPQHNQP